MHPSPPGRSSIVLLNDDFCVELANKQCVDGNLWITFERCVSLEWSGTGSTIQLDHSDQDASKEPMNPLWPRIHRFLPSFGTPWSKWSWINDPGPDHPKETHPGIRNVVPFELMKCRLTGWHVVAFIWRTHRKLRTWVSPIICTPEI